MFTIQDEVILIYGGPYNKWYRGSIGIWNYELRKFQGFCDVGWGKYVLLSH